MANIPPPPPEWAPHDAVWIGFPSHPELWEGLAAARAEVAMFAHAVHAGGKGEQVILVAADEEAAAVAEAQAGQAATILIEPFGDIWLRDTGPIFGGDRAAHKFAFNGWGGKYDYDGDEDVGERLARTRGGVHLAFHDWVLEGGALDGDGEGRVVTTEQCLLNRNRNPGLGKDEVETLLLDNLGYTSVLWLGNGLLNDHTDGHVDNLARFVGPNRLLVPQATDNDPNWLVYQDAAARAGRFGCEVIRFPSPGRVLDRDGEIVPASYMNFYVGNAAVVVPLYGQANDDAAIAALEDLFPDRAIAGVRADHILTGGGSFHCISQQIPRY
ncbi:agmatine deiminase family protein [Sphingomonas sp.]|uniref:agmatine deiminase family protein n=1 Tax=Sphingomonas sp. TaxID=28214 RepID=UPI001B05EA68|nr:agmatine deiminase family protein [Sphingomonas sp.]MBO9714842.1 agmatine deiminase family protein [Sphingomonas sp.]